MSPALLRRRPGRAVDLPATPPTGGDGRLHVTVRDVHVVGRRGPLLELPGLTFASGECVLLAGEPGQGHTALALVVTGRLRPAAGEVLLTDADGSVTSSARALRRVTAVVDLPGVSEPDDVLTVRTVVAEGLALARRRSGPWATRRWLRSHEMWEHRKVRIDDVYGPVRTALLTSLAAERASVRFLVLPLPDRHGGEPSGWWAVAQAFAGRGYGVLVLAGRSAARDVGATLPASRGATDRRAPVEALRTVAQTTAVPVTTVVTPSPAVPEDADGPAAGDTGGSPPRRSSLAPPVDGTEPPDEVDEETVVHPDDEGEPTAGTTGPGAAPDDEGDDEGNQGGGNGERDDAPGVPAEGDDVRPDEAAPGRGAPGARSTRTDDTQPLPGVEP